MNRTASAILREYLYCLTLRKLKEVNSGTKADKCFFGTDRRQYFQLFVPDAGDPMTTAVVFIHGGGWTLFEPDDFRYIGRYFVRLGFPTISLGYRHMPQYKYPSQLEDICQGYAQAIQQMKERNLKINDLIIVGFSSGAHLGGLMAYKKSLRYEYGLDILPVRGFCSIAGAVVIGSDASRKSWEAKVLIGMLFRKDYDRSLADPYNYVEVDDNVQVLCVHSINDPLLDYHDSVDFIEKVNRNGRQLGTIYLENDRKFQHTNLCVEMFTRDMPASRVVKEWLEKRGN